MKTKAAILNELNKPLIVDDIEIPKLKVGQVLVQIHYSGICGAQIGEIQGAGGEDKHLPHLLGHEGAGVVVEIGEGVTTVKEDDNVVCHWRKGDGIDSQFPIYKWGNKKVGGGKVTTFSEYSVVSENRLTKTDKKYPLREASLMGCSITTGLGLINNEARLKIGQSILVIGCGGIGMNVIQGARMISAHPIIAVDKKIDRLEEACGMGATITTTSVSLIEIIEGHYIDVVVDTTGNSGAIEKGWKMVSSGGKMILVGQPNHKDCFEFDYVRENFYTNKVMFDSQGGLTNPTVDIPRYLELYAVGKLDIDGGVGYPLEDINEAIEDMQQGTVIKPILKMRYEKCRKVFKRN